MFDFPSNHKPAQNETKQPPVKEVSPEESTVLGLAFAGELGYIIAVPVIVLGIGGAKLDDYLGSQHIFFFLGLIVAFVTSSMTVWKKIRIIQKRMPKDLPRKKKHKVDPETAREQEALHDLFRPPSEK